jgi:ABC-type glycerol-3-phosphate transport system permease component
MAVKTVDRQVGTRTKIRDTGLDLVFILVLYFLLSLILGILVYPLIFVLSASVSDPSAIMAGKVVLFPVGFTLKAYQAVLDYDLIWVGFGEPVCYDPGWIRPIQERSGW